MNVVRQQAQNDLESTPVFPGLSRTVLVGCSPPSPWGKQGPWLESHEPGEQAPAKVTGPLGSHVWVWCFLPCGGTPMSHSGPLTDSR